VDAKRIIIFVILLGILGFFSYRACQRWRMYNPRPTPAAVPAPAPAPAK